MTNVIDFDKKREDIMIELKNGRDSKELFTMSMYLDQDEQYELFMEMTDYATEYEVFCAMQAAFMKFGLEHGFLTDVEESEDEDE